MDNIGVYIHIPFCIKKCKYCDFNSFSSSERTINRYISAISKEFKLYNLELKSKNIRSVFIGGGTPSILSCSQIEILINSLKENADLSNVKEFTIEINPGTVNVDKLKLYKKLGINRLSFGVQSFNDKILKEIGRIHNSDEGRNSVLMAKEVGFDNINIDLMYNLPNQSIKDIVFAIKEAKILGATHISLYSLIIEENTEFYKMNLENKLNLMTEEEEEKAFDRAYEELESSGFKRYEISNYAKDNMKSLHNLAYWRNEDYFGFGLGAHGKVGNIRYNNYINLNEYFEKIEKNMLPVANEIKLEYKDNIFEGIMVGLRLVEGIDISEFNIKYNISLLDYYKDEIKDLKNKKLLTVEDGRIFFTKFGMNVSNYALLKFIRD